MIDLPPSQLEEVRRILRRWVPDRRVAAFGSRVTGDARRYSDLDLVILGEEPLPLSTLFQLKDAFEESDLPIRVDVVDQARMAPDFFERLREQMEIID
ncbi:MAG TPA: nucleotidyltransferase domain-containing protein [Chromatiales bacterium]|nr:nucleotidyltransferase domain-containing protein [Chromatiales bacterium]